MRRCRLLVPMLLAVGCSSPDVVDTPPPLQTADQREADYKRNLRADRTWAEQERLLGNVKGAFEQSRGADASGPTVNPGR
ncbi:MAG TPA: hypothetical protein VKE40_17230 [Gemmataceae bacterium]|nr:hypothetical protein [Gemmataceae bacterium]